MDDFATRFMKLMAESENDTIQRLTSSTENSNISASVATDVQLD